jgi:hypothetical protein
MEYIFLARRRPHVRVKITNDSGQPQDTRVLDLDTGQPLAVTWLGLDLVQGTIHVTLAVPKAQLDLVSDQVTVQEAAPAEASEIPTDEV